MVLIIKKRDVTDTREPAPLVASASPVAAPATPPTVDANRLHDWKTKHPPMNAHARQCSWCKHHYIMPCADADIAMTCENYIHIRTAGQSPR